MGDIPLKEAFSVLYGLALDPGGMVKDFFDSDRNSWSPRFRRNLNYWEMDEMCNLLTVLNGIRPNNSLVDDWAWALKKKGVFSSKSLYMALVQNRVSGFPLKTIWNSRIPSKVVFFPLDCIFG